MASVLLPVRLSILFILVLTSVVSADLFSDTYQLTPDFWPNFQLTRKNNPPFHLESKPSLSTLSCMESHCTEPESHCHLQCEANPHNELPDRLINEKEVPLAQWQQPDRTLLAQINQGRLLIMNIAPETPYQPNEADLNLSVLYKTSTGTNKISRLPEIGISEQIPPDRLHDLEPVHFVVDDHQDISWVSLKDGAQWSFMRLDSYLLLERQYELYLRWKRATRRTEFYDLPLNKHTGKTSTRGRKRKQPPSTPKQEETPPEKKTRENTFVVNVAPQKRVRQISQKRREAEEVKPELDRLLDGRKGKKPMVIANKLKIPKWLVELKDDSLLNDAEIKTRKSQIKKADNDQKPKLKIELLWLKVAKSIKDKGKWNGFVIQFHNNLSRNIESWPETLGDVWHDLITLATNLSKERMNGEPEPDADVDDVMENELLGVWIDQTLRDAGMDTEWRTLRLNPRKRKHQEKKTPEKTKRPAIIPPPPDHGYCQPDEESNTGESIGNEPVINTEQRQTETPSPTLQEIYDIHVLMPTIPDSPQTEEIEVDGIVVVSRCDKCSDVHDMEEFVPEERILLKDAETQTDALNPQPSARDGYIPIFLLEQLVSIETNNKYTRPSFLEELRAAINACSKKSSQNK